MDWLRKNWRLALLNGAGLLIALAIIPGFFNAEDMHPIFNASFEASALWAMRFLLFSLAMSPLNTYLGWRGAVTLRKSAGLWAFAFATMHGAFHLLTAQYELPILLQQRDLLLGILGLTILALMAVTSNRWAMKWLGKTWKRLHKLVYIAGVAVVVHALLAFSSSKKAFFGETSLTWQIPLYMGLMFALLALRLPLVRQAIKSVQSRGARGRAVTAG